MASGGEDRRIRLWDLATSSLLKELRGHTETVYSLVWSGDSSILSSGGLDGTVRMWNIQGSSGSQHQYQNGPLNEAPNSVSAEMVATYPTNCSNIINLWYSPHNTLVATGIGSGSGGLNNSSGGGGISVIKSFQILNGSNNL